MTISDDIPGGLYISLLQLTTCSMDPTNVAAFLSFESLKLLADYSHLELSIILVKEEWKPIYGQLDLPDHSS